MKERTFKIQSIEDFINNQYSSIFEFVCIINRQVNLKEDEYFATMVTDYDKTNPHIEVWDWLANIGLVGIEKTSGEGKGYYISKIYNKRNGRGKTIIVKVIDKSKCIEL